MLFLPIWQKKSVILIHSHQMAIVVLAVVIFFFFTFFKDFIYLFLERGEGREKERERNINVWLPLTCPLLGTRPTTQVCALTGNQTGDPLVSGLALNPLSHTSQGCCLFIWQSKGKEVNATDWLDKYSMF